MGQDHSAKKLSYTLRDGAVVVTLRGVTGNTAIVGESEAKRFAWAILADLDPEEANKAALESGVKLESTSGYAVRGSRRRVFLQALFSGCKTNREVADFTGDNNAVVAARLSHLRGLGLVCRTDGGEGRGSLAAYGLTSAGREALLCAA